ncbi:hypothetical protein V7S43_002602 [Phytophthora oleae]|uniref:Uncharacterized protein n=1 Tax=Phytophthora oleae TaxID=2107226 RepID=A0ABD3G1K5_9STRA
MTRLQKRFETLDLDDVRQWVSENNDDFLLEANIPLETWNRLAEMDRIPQNLKLSQLVWAAETVWLVEFPSGPHGLAASHYDKMLDRQLGDLIQSPRDMKTQCPKPAIIRAGFLISAKA